MVRDTRSIFPLSFVMAWLPVPSGGERCTVVAFSNDGSMWVDPALFGIGPQHSAQLKQFPGGEYLLVHGDARRVLLNAQAVVLVVTEANWVRYWLRFVEDFIAHEQKTRQQHESAQQN